MAKLSRLLLLRHAKSSWDDPGLADHDRPLAPRGHRAAQRIGTYLRGEHIAISVVLCSSAARAQGTLGLLRLGGEPMIEVDAALYTATADELLQRVRGVPDDAETALLIGHNPAMQDLALALVGGDLATRRFPTGALAQVTWPGPWRELTPGRAELAAFVTPRELG